MAADLAAIDTTYLLGEPVFWRAPMAAVLDEEERPIALLRQAFAEGQYSRAWYQHHVARDFDALRESAAFRELMRPKV